MSETTTPEGYRTVTPYLVIRGVPRLLEFVERAFGAEVRERMEDGSGGVNHAAFRIGDSMVMAGEAPSAERVRPGVLYLYVADADAAFARAVQAGGTVVREPADQPYGDRNAAVSDPSGNEWWVATRR